MWIKFANLCRKSERMGLAEKTLNSLMPTPHDPIEHVSVARRKRPTDSNSPSIASVPFRSIFSPQVPLGVWEETREPPLDKQLCRAIVARYQSFGNTSEGRTRENSSEMLHEAGAMGSRNEDNLEFCKYHLRSGYSVLTYTAFLDQHPRHFEVLSASYAARSKMVQGLAHMGAGQLRGDRLPGEQHLGGRSCECQSRWLYHQCSTRWGTNSVSWPYLTAK